MTPRPAKFYLTKFDLTSISNPNYKLTWLTNLGILIPRSNFEYINYNSRQKHVLLPQNSYTGSYTGIFTIPHLKNLSKYRKQGFQNFNDLLRPIGFIKYRMHKHE